MNANRRPATTWSVLRIFLGDLLVLIGLLLLAEVVLRATAPRNLNRLMRHIYEVTDTPAGYRYIPGTRTICNNGYGDHLFEINAWDARDREYGPKRDAELRLLCIGDSFSENQALDVDQIWPNIMEDSLAREVSRPVSVINAGMAGWGLWDYRDYLQRMLPVIRPDIVVLAVEVNGDAVSRPEPPKPVRMSLLWGLPVRADSSPANRALWGMWLVNELLECRSHAFVAFRELTYYPGIVTGLTRVVTFSPLCTDPQRAEQVVEPTAQVLRELRELCEREKVRLVLLAVPLEYTISPDAADLKVQLELPKIAQLDLSAPRRTLEAIASRADVPLYDPSNVLRDTKDRSFIPVFGHWSEAGNAAVAEGLLEFLKKKEILTISREAARLAPATARADTCRSNPRAACSR